MLVNNRTRLIYDWWIIKNSKIKISKSGKIIIIFKYYFII